MEDPVELLRKLVAINSVNNPKDNIKPSDEAVNLLKTVMNRDLGMETKKFQRDGYYSIFGSLLPIKQDVPSVLLMAHLDVVPVTIEGWKTDPFTLEVKGDKAYGRGAQDCKGGVVSAILCLQILKKKRPNINVHALFTSDEEIGGKNGAEFASEMMREGQLPRPTWIINYDGGFKIINRRRAGYRVSVAATSEFTQVTGSVSQKEFHTTIVGEQTLHSAYFVAGSDSHALVTLSKFLFQNPDFEVVDLDTASFVKSNVIPEKVAVKLVNTKIKDSEQSSITVDKTFNSFLRRIRTAVKLCMPTDFASEYGIGITPNIITREEKEFTIEFDLRIMSRNVDMIQTEFQNLFPEAEVNVRWGGGYVYTDSDNPLVVKALELAPSYGLPSEVFEQAGATDSRYFCSIGIPCIDLGPEGKRVHGHNEYVTIPSISSLGKFTASLCCELVNVE